ncbi:hypothetical protein ABGF28_04540, partial [Helcococcus ovis]
NLVKELNLDLIENACSKKGRKPVIAPISIFQILIYCYSEGIKSTRKIDNSIKKKRLLQNKIFSYFATVLLIN